MDADAALRPAIRETGQFGNSLVEDIRDTLAEQSPECLVAGVGRRALIASVTGSVAALQG
jgi:hypothetical protein